MGTNESEQMKTRENRWNFRSLLLDDIRRPKFQKKPGTFGAEKVFEEMTCIFSSWQNAGLQSQGAKQTPTISNVKKSTPRHITVKLQETRGKEEICKPWAMIRRGLQEGLQGSQVFQMLKGKSYHPCIPCESWLFGLFLIKASLCLFTREFSSFIVKVTKERREVPFHCFAIRFLCVPCISLCPLPYHWLLLCFIVHNETFKLSFHFLCIFFDWLLIGYHRDYD